VESVKAASDIYAPVSGQVVEANKELEGNPTLINESPYAQGMSHVHVAHQLGWLCKIKIADASEVDGLMTEEAYGKHTEDH
jgi:glycine cleavage system H protein